MKKLGIIKLLCDMSISPANGEKFYRRQHKWRAYIEAAIKLYLQKKEIAFTYSNKTKINYNIFLTALPRWLNAPSEYFSAILDNDSLSKAEKKEQIKAQVKKDFRCLKKPPKWIQDYNWPISNGKPLVFVGQLELDIEIFHDKGAVYVFLNTDTGEIETVKQFY